MKPYTGRGDNGTTRINIHSSIISKNDPCVELIGNIDELNASVGECIHNYEDIPQIVTILTDVQSLLMKMMAIIPCRYTDNEDNVDFDPKEELRIIEGTIDIISDQLKPIANFVYPQHEGCYANTARTIARRCERSLVHPKFEDKFASLIPIFNRLSSLFFVIMRYVNAYNGRDEELFNVNSSSSSDSEPEEEQEDEEPANYVSLYHILKYTIIPIALSLTLRLLTNRD